MSTQSSVSSSTRAPVFRCARIGDIFVHEEVDGTRSTDLVQLLDQQQFLANPVIVTESGQGAERERRYQLAPAGLTHMDGATRISALRWLGFPLILVQVVDVADPAQVELSVWAHATAVDLPGFVEQVKQVPGVAVEAMEPDAARPQPADAAYVFGRGAAYRLQVADGGLAARQQALCSVVALYQHRIDRRRLPVLPDQATVDRVLAGDTGAAPADLLVTFVPLTPAEFQSLAGLKVKAPAGMTRFVLPGGRALGVQIPLRLLKPEAEAERRDFLEATQARQPRVIAGPAVVDEYRGPRVYDDTLLVYDPNLKVQAA